MNPDLARKLGLKPAMHAVAVNVPMTLQPVLNLPSAASGQADFLLAFVARKAEVEPQAAALLPQYRRGAALWFAYPKKSGTVKSDMSRDDGWDALAAHDLLPVRQIAIDADWSALRFRYRDEIAKLTRKF